MRFDALRCAARESLKVKIKYDGDTPSHIYPWHSWIARKTPTLEVAGSNPVG